MTGIHIRKKATEEGNKEERVFIVNFEYILHMTNDLIRKSVMKNVKIN